MLIIFATTVALNAALQVAPTRPQHRAVVRDSSVVDSSNRSARRRLPVTAEVLATAFRDPAARELFYRARRARLTQDSSLTSYEAKVRSRVSVGMSIGTTGRERMFYRRESASRVRWQRDVGARVELTGARMALPIVSPKDERNEFLANLADGELAVVPYFPGSEALWIGGVAQIDVDERSLVNPVAEGAEAYYTFETGDSISLTLPDSSTVRLREIKVRPRSARWNLAIGSLTFDLRSGHLVQAVYRLATPIDVWANIAEQADTNRAARIVAGIARGIVSPFKNEITEVTIEYSLFDGRFWLPRTQTMKGVAVIAFAHLPVSFESAYRYSSVNSSEPVAPIAINTRDFLARVQAPDSLTGEAARKWRDSVWRANHVARDALRDSLDKGACDSTGTRTLARTRYDGQLAIALTFPCNVDKLINSPDFEKPIYDPAEGVFGSSDRNELVARALALGAQAPLSLLKLTRPRLEYGLPMTRYNRVEGFSTGMLAEQRVGGGYSVIAEGRFGAADRTPNGALSISRTNLSKTITLSAYGRLVAANDWGRPLSFSSSVPAFLFGRDEGFYYRASGVELGFQTSLGPALEWRLFAERQRTAWQGTSYSMSGELGPNIIATSGPSAGAQVRFVQTYGLDPRGFRAFADVRLEGAHGDSSYARGALDLTLSRGFAKNLSAAITLAGGSTTGDVPPQRRWYLGGTQTIRGQSADTAQSGNAFWMTRAEVGQDVRAFRQSLFVDLGWVGDRTKMREVGRPMSGVGVGFSVLDGLARIDLARGLYPKKQFRLDLTVGARW